MRVYCHHSLKLYVKNRVVLSTCITHMSVIFSKRNYNREFMTGNFLLLQLTSELYLCEMKWNSRFFGLLWIKYSGTYRRLRLVDRHVFHFYGHPFLAKSNGVVQSNNSRTLAYEYLFVLKAIFFSCGDILVMVATHVRKRCDYRIIYKHFEHNWTISKFIHRELRFAALTQANFNLAIKYQTA